MRRLVMNLTPMTNNPPENITPPAHTTIPPHPHPSFPTLSNIAPDVGVPTKHPTAIPTNKIPVTEANLSTPPITTPATVMAVDMKAPQTSP
ncbi:hypothetical protein BG015_002508 [Linnemannia schmuckeri]|uniref:Uncharacterized protein n=1 Tax=Linnemannia schmuckeri TaxID=64567 RepID=A0A9P5S5C1_9FUNG|nr:hypothetical protein BG015_002508 [Linnemannia schmuckeri]